MDNSSFSKGLRHNAFLKLKTFIKNPGRFSLMVIGKRGTGKKLAIEEIFKEYPQKDNNSLCLKELLFIKTKNISTKEELSKIFLKENEYKTVVFVDIDEIKDELNPALFEALETTDGKLGIKEKIDIRIIFTSSINIDLLRTEKTNISSKLWERISQLIVEFPSFSEEKDYIIDDFKATWNKMKFEEIENYNPLGNYPENTKLQVFLDKNAHKFEGGFRDLDKIAILYFNYRILLYKKENKINEETEKKIVNHIEEDFFGKIQYKADEDNYDLYVINWDKKWKETLSDFKYQIRILWKKKHPKKSYQELENKLGLGIGTTKNWKKH